MVGRASEDLRELGHLLTLKATNVLESGIEWQRTPTAQAGFADHVQSRSQYKYCQANTN